MSVTRNQEPLWTAKHYTWWADRHEEFTKEMLAHCPHPDCTGEQLALAVLKECLQNSHLNNLYQEAASYQARNQLGKFFSEKLNEMGGGVLPTIPEKQGGQKGSFKKRIWKIFPSTEMLDDPRTHENKHKPQEHMSMDLFRKQWIGLALLCVFAAGAGAGIVIVSCLRRRRETAKNNNPPISLHGPDAASATQRPAVKRRRLALSLFPENRPEPINSSIARGLFTEARYWWTGDAAEWPNLEVKAHLKPSHTNDDANVGILVAVYEWEGDEQIAERISGSQVLSKLIDDNKLTIVGVFEGEISSIKNAGFRQQ